MIDYNNIESAAANETESGANESGVNETQDKLVLCREDTGILSSTPCVDNSNRIKFIDALRSHFSDEAVIGFINMLDRTDFFVAPYTTKYKGSYEGGLCEHCLAVYKRCLPEDINDIRGIELAEIALIHDIGKVNYFEWNDFAKKIDGKWVGGYRVKEARNRRPLGNFGFKSYLMAKNFFDFTEEQIEALCNFCYVTRQNDCVEILTMMEQNDLITKLHCADIMETYC